MEDTEQTVTRLTTWENEPSIEDLKKNLTDAESDHSGHITDVKRWLSNLYITGAAKINPGVNKSKVVPKLIRKQAEWRYSSLADPFLSTPDIFNVYPTTAGDRKRAQQNALVLNNQFNTKINKIKFIDDYVRDAVDIGTVIVEVGWESREEEVIVKKPVYNFKPIPQNDVIIKQYINLLQLRKTNKDLYEEHMNPGLDQVITKFAQTGELFVAEQVGVQEVTELKETINRPTVEVCDENNIVIDPSCNGDIDKAGFIGKKFKTSLSDLKKDGRYTNLEFINIEAASPLASPDYEEPGDTESFNFTDKPRKKFVVHMYYGEWDIDNSGQTQPILAAWVNSTMIRLEKNAFPDKKPPFVKAVYMPVRKSVYGEPDGELLEDNQKIIGAITRGVIDLMAKSANSQTGFRMDLLNVTNQRKFKRGEDYEFNSTVDPRQAIYQHTYPEIPASAYNVIQMQNTEAESLTGVKAFSSGITGEAIGKNVGNARSALDAASKREKGILNRLAAGIIQIGRKFISMNAEFLSEEEIVRITNEKFVTVRRDDLPGNFDLRLAISTAEEDNKKAEELAFMLQTTGNNMDPGLRNMLLSDIARLRKMPDTAKRIEDFKPEPDPLIEMEQKLKIHLLKAQIAKEETLAIKHAATAELDGVKGQREKTQAALNLAKKGTEEAKTRNLGSDADNKDLDYLEKESGTTQARDLEKLNIQAQNNMATTIVTDSLKPTEAAKNEK